MVNSRRLADNIDKKRRRIVRTIVVLTIIPLFVSGIVVNPLGQQQLAAALTTTNIIGDPSLDSTNPQIVVSGSDVFLIWQELDFTTSTNEIYFIKSSDNGLTYDAAVNVSNNTGDSKTPDIAVLSTAIGFVVWSDNTDIASGNNDIFFNEIIGGVPGDAVVNISESPNADSITPQIAVSAPNVLIVWEEQGEIYLARSIIGTPSATIVNLSNTPSTTSANPRIAVSALSVFVVWQELDSNTFTNDIYLARSTDGGANFDTTVINVSNSPDQDSSWPDVIITGGGSNLLIVWQELDPVTFTNDILIAKSTNTEIINFASIVNLSDTPTTDSILPSIGASSDGGNVFIIWQEFSFATLSSEIFVAPGFDGGNSFDCPSLVGSSADFTGTSNAHVAADGATVHTVWEDINFDSFTTDIIATSDLDYQAPYISLKLVSNNPDSDFDGVVESKWGLESDAVTISGRIANADEGDTVLVDWGDGVSTDTATITISTCSIDPVSHVYDSSAVELGINQISASLIDGDTGEAKATASSSIPVAVLAHATSLILNPLASVRNGTDVTVSGQLNDTDKAEGISGMPITLDGSGADALVSATIVTDGTGFFSATGPSPTTVATGWAVQAHFSGDIPYEFSDSELQFYSTVDPGAQEFEVSAGLDVPVELSGFNAAVTFDNVLSPGKVFVVPCTIGSETSRFLVQGSICLEISPGVSLAPGSALHITMSFASQTLPAGYTFSDVDIFVEESTDTFIDITESRDVNTATVTGFATGSGKFIGAVAVHPEKPPGATRQQLYVGSNTITFNNPPIASLDKTSYNIGETATLTIIDANRNLDPSALDSVTASVNSTSDPTGITIGLQENGMNSGVFMGTFIVTSNSSSGNQLKVAADDDITISYAQAPDPYFIAVIDDVVEAGVVDLLVSTIDPEPLTSLFGPVNSAVDLKLVDAQLGGNANIRITMSYENHESMIFAIGDTPSHLRVYHKEIRLDDEGQEVEFWCEITLSDVAVEDCTIGRSNPQAVNLEQKTVSGETRTLSTISNTFSMGFDLGTPGGAGGGLGLPGGGVVLDFIASRAITAPSSDGTGGGSSGGGRGSSVTQAPTTINKQVSEGSNVEVTASTSTGTIEITFESVTSASSRLTITENPDIEDYADLFESVELSRGNIVMPVSSGTDGLETAIEYRTLGSIYDIDLPNDLEYSGNIWVTIAYNEASILAAGGNENKIRMLHYFDGGATGGLTPGSSVQGDEVNATGWEDVTAFIDTENNTISGYFGSLSPIALAITEDNTFGKAYFEANPLAKILVSDTSWALPTSGVTVSPSESAKAILQAGQQVSISSSIENIQRNSQQFVYLVQVLDDQDIVRSINWQTGVLTMGQDTDVSVLWTPEESGRYSVKILVWDSLDSATVPSPLSTIAIMHIQVSE